MRLISYFAVIDGLLDDALDTAGTVLFLVWNDTNHTGSLERTGILAGPKQRQLVIKYSRLFNLTP